ncbi:MAG: hypothetical protein SPH44_00090 [Eubacteriales bacterium]|mgnify:CR=1 FL=1|nr:hypothetical protein [Eubacteriales bacterium]
MKVLNIGSCNLDYFYALDHKEILKIASADLKSRYVYYINRDAVMDDLIKKLTLN